MQADVLLIGGGVASARCARALRRNGFGGSIVLVGEEPLPPYNRPPLSKELLRGDASEDLLAALPNGWYERQNVGLEIGASVVELDPGERRAVLADGRTVRYERCLLATGASPRTLPIPGAGRALLLRSLADAGRIREAARTARSGAPVVVIGGGLIGVEVASGLAALGLRPTILEQADALWGGSMGRLLSVWARQKLTDVGVAVMLETAATAVVDGGVSIADELVPGAFVVAGIGVRARDELAAAAGLPTSNGVDVDAGHRTVDPAIWAAGDVARVDARAGEHWHAAREGGERAALSMLGAPPEQREPAWIFTEVAGVAIDVFGDATREDDEAWVVPQRLIARSSGGRVSQLIAIGGSLPATEGRRMVAARLPLAEIRETWG